MNRIRIVIGKHIRVQAETHKAILTYLDKVDKQTYKQTRIKIIISNKIHVQAKTHTDKTHTNKHAYKHTYQ